MSVWTRATIAICMALWAHGPAHGQLWKEVGDWSIDVVKDDRYCMASVEYKNGAALFLAVVPDIRRLKLSFVSDKWQSIKDERKYEMTVYLDQRRESWTMTGIRLNSHGGIETYLTLAGMNRIAEASTILLAYEGESLGRFTLRGSMAALEELRRCQFSINSAGWPSAENPPDPFRR